VASTNFLDPPHPSENLEESKTKGENEQLGSDPIQIGIRKATFEEGEWCVRN